MRHSATARRRRATGLTALVMALAGPAALAGSPSAAQADTLASEARHVTLEVSSSTGGLGSAAAVTLSNGGELLGDAPGILLVSIPEHAQQRLIEVVDGEVRPPALVDVRPQPSRSGEPIEDFGPTTGAQVSVTNAAPWHLAGFDGSGIRIGVVDFFDVTSHWNVDEHGPLPSAGVTARCFDSGTDCTEEFFDGVDLGGEEHGIAVVEVIRDMAPGAEIFIGQASTASDYGELVDWFVANRVQIVNRSLGSRYDGPGDGRGTLDEIVSNAVSRGILWVNSGGNNAENHYYRHQVRLIGDRVAFGPSGSDPYLPFSGCVALGGVRWANDWDKPAGDRTDYDIYLWESPTGDPDAGSLVSSSTRDQRNGADPIELLYDTYCPGPGMTLYLEARWLGGDISGDVLEVLDYGSGIAAHTQSASSAAVSIVDSDERGVIAVGAIDPPDGGVIGAYSSQGPTNDGGLAPDVAAPSGFFSSVYNGSFAGTSASAPVVAGAAALLLDAGLAVNPPTLGDLIRNFTVDRGPSGADDIYGHGEFRLPDPPPSNPLDATPSRFVGLDVPARLLDTRPETAVGPAPLIGEVWAGELLELPILGSNGIPSVGVTAVVANLVTVEPDRPSYLQALPTGQAGLGSYSNINADGAGEVRANLAVVPVGDDGSISIYSIANGHVVVDVLGWFETTTGAVNAGRFVELTTPQRLLDTRTAGAAIPLSSGDVRSVPMPAGIDPSLIGSLVVTVTSTASTAAGWIQAFPSDRLSEVGGRTSTVNVSPGSNVANLAIVPVGRDGISLTGKFGNGTSSTSDPDADSSHVVVDAVGYITSEAAPTSERGRYVPVTPSRAYDSRVTGGQVVDRQMLLIDASGAEGVSVPSDATGVLWNIAAISVMRPGYARGWAAEQSEPSTSALNWSSPGESRAGAVVTAVDAGTARFRIEDGSADLPGAVAHLIADVFGYFT